MIMACAVAHAAETDGWLEANYRDALCTGMKMEVSLSNFGRADCVSNTHAVEVEWADKFKQGVGQALTYATSTSLVPGLILICRRTESSCLNASLTAQETFSAFGIETTIWECGKESVALSDCTARHVSAKP